MKKMVPYNKEQHGKNRKENDLRLNTAFQKGNDPGRQNGADNKKREAKLTKETSHKNQDNSKRSGPPKCSE